MKNFFNGKELVDQIIPDETIPHGAAIEANSYMKSIHINQSTNEVNYELCDVIPCSLDIKEVMVQ